MNRIAAQDFTSIAAPGSDPKLMAAADDKRSRPFL
jgi:hypothetical protein